MHAEIFHVRIPFLGPFANATGATHDRDLVLLRIGDTEGEGWGEAATWPGQTTDSLDDVWASLTTDLPLSPTARVAHETALADHQARVAGVPVHGASGQALPASAAVGMRTERDLLSEVARLHDGGFRRVKLKIAPGHDVDLVDAVRRRWPALAIDVDANGSYPSVDAVPEALAGLDVASIEQPLMIGMDLAASVEVETRLGVPVILDEDVRDTGEAIRVLESGLVPCVKAARLGPSAVWDIAARATATGGRIKLSGLFETSLGKAVTISMAHLPEVGFADLAPAGTHLAGDVVSDPWTVVDGTIRQRSGPGWGVTVDRSQIERFLVRQAPAMLPATG